ncbi:Hypothetical_protein [Hexamita inflata]|uniref:Hypothetical_protein n=1 Tax=Hexamita inflata TaxID=28002 RepID=A0AA86NB06_9EUKA|nr:Hypothetical protein HINF_LOCUS3733 [Hexamita inflata]
MLKVIFLEARQSIEQSYSFLSVSSMKSWCEQNIWASFVSRMYFLQVASAPGNFFWFSSERRAEIRCLLSLLPQRSPAYSATTYGFGQQTWSRALPSFVLRKQRLWSPWAWLLDAAYLWPMRSSWSWAERNGKTASKSYCSFRSLFSIFPSVLKVGMLAFAWVSWAAWVSRWYVEMFSLETSCLQTAAFGSASCRASLISSSSSSWWVESLVSFWTIFEMSPFPSSFISWDTKSRSLWGSDFRSTSCGGSSLTKDSRIFWNFWSRMFIYGVDDMNKQLRCVRGGAVWIDNVYTILSEFIAFSFRGQQTANSSDSAEKLVKLVTRGVYTISACYYCPLVQFFHFLLCS